MKTKHKFKKHSNRAYSKRNILFNPIHANYECVNLYIKILIILREEKRKQGYKL
jgi:hypothetical protein